MPNESQMPDDISNPPAYQRGTDAGDLILKALNFIRGSLPGNGEASGPPSLAWQKSRLLQWADHLGLLLNSTDLPEKLIRGGQEHELFHDQLTDRYIKVTSQPRFDIIPVSTAEIDAWFAARGFEKITDSAYYRREDNLGVFDAHDKNLVRADDDLIPFDVIPCQPAGGFLTFIEETLKAGHSLLTIRTITNSCSRSKP